MTGQGKWLIRGCSGWQDDGPPAATCTNGPLSVTCFLNKCLEILILYVLMTLY